jgi:hypothetical protein
VVRRRWGWALGRRWARPLRIWMTTSLMVALLGPPAGLLWAAISPPVRYVIVDGEALLADPETQALIGAEGRFAVMTALAGLVCGAIGYAAGGRRRDIPLVLGLAAGGLAAGLLAWRVGHLVGPDSLERLTRGGADGRMAVGPADLRAFGVLVFWPLLAVVAFGLLEATDVAGRASGLGPGDAGGEPGGQPDQVGGSQFDLQAAPAGGDVDGGEPRR